MLMRRRRHIRPSRVLLVSRHLVLVRDALCRNECVWIARLAWVQDRRVGTVAVALGADGRGDGEEVRGLVLDAVGGDGACIARQTGCGHVVDGSDRGGVGFVLVDPV